METIKDKLNKIPFPYFVLSNLIFLFWGVLGLILYPQQSIHVLLIAASITVLIRLIYSGARIDRVRLLYGFIIFGIIMTITTIFNL